MNTASPLATEGAAGRLSASLAVAVTVTLWASAFVVIRWVAPHLGPGPLALLRLAAGSATLTALVLIRHLRSTRGVRYRASLIALLPTGRSLVLTIGYGVAWFAAYTVLLNWAEHHLDAGTSAMLINVAPVLIALGAGLLLGEGLPVRLFGGMAVALVGVVLIGIAGGSGQVDALGVVLGLSAALLYTAGMLLQKVVLRSTDPFIATWVGCTAGLVATLPFLPQTVGDLVGVPARAVLGAVLLGVGPTAIGFAAWAYAQTHISTGRLAGTSLIIPAVAVLLAALTLHEFPPALAIVGGVLCLTGAAISRFARRSPVAAGPGADRVPVGRP